MTPPPGLDVVDAEFVLLAPMRIDGDRVGDLDKLTSARVRESWFDGFDGFVVDDSAAGDLLDDTLVGRPHVCRTTPVRPPVPVYRKTVRMQRMRAGDAT